MLTDLIISNSLEELLERRAELGMKSLFVAGGTEINRMGSPLTDGSYIGLSMEKLALDEIKVTEEGITIGTMVTLQQLIDSVVIPEYIKDAARFAGSRTLRNMATIGGNIASCRDDSYLLPTCIAAKARIHTVDIDQKGEIIREDIPIREFVENFDNFKGSCITEIFIKKQDRFVKTRRYSRTVQRTPDALISFGAEVHDGILSDVRIAVGSLGCGIKRLPDIEQSVMNRDLQGETQCLQAVKRAISPPSDITGSAEYKHYLVGITIEDLMNEAKGGQ